MNPITPGSAYVDGTIPVIQPGKLLRLQGAIWLCCRQTVEVTGRIHCLMSATIGSEPPLVRFQRYTANLTRTRRMARCSQNVAAALRSHRHAEFKRNGEMPVHNTVGLRLGLTFSAMASAIQVSLGYADSIRKEIKSIHMRAIGKG